MEGFLNELAERPAGALVLELPRLPGARENRWIHLLSGEPDLSRYASAAPAYSAPGPDISSGEIAALKANVARLEGEVGELKVQMARLMVELGIQP